MTDPDGPSSSVCKVCGSSACEPEKWLAENPDDYIVTHGGVGGEGKGCKTFVEHQAYGECCACNDGKVMPDGVYQFTLEDSNLWLDLCEPHLLELVSKIKHELARIQRVKAERTPILADRSDTNPSKPHQPDHH